MNEKDEIIKESTLNSNINYIGNPKPFTYKQFEEGFRRMQEDMYKPRIEIIHKSALERINKKYE